LGQLSFDSGTPIPIIPPNAKPSITGCCRAAAA
jgi:hypothetical protein